MGATQIRVFILRKFTTLAAFVAVLAPMSAAKADAALGGGFLQWMVQGTATRAAPSDPFASSGVVITPSQDQDRVYVPAPRVRRVGGANVIMATVPQVASAQGYAPQPTTQEMIDAALKANPPQAAPPMASNEEHAAISPEFLRQEVDYGGAERPGTIIIDTEQRFLFCVLSGHRAVRYGVGVGRPGFEWAGVKTVTRKAEWPDWTPPVEMMLRRPDIPDHMPGGMDNPLGARALYLGSSLYRIHGTNEPWTIGTNVSSGCIRMMNEDVIDLYDRAKVGTKVTVI
jgi:lipoprotein-anchoring transpeptidase ErfK/SrfK